MKITPIRTVALAGLAGAALFVSANRASAVEVGIQVGTPPPPVIVEHPWARPYPEAVWIAGHHEWVDGAWVWVGGYYAYPPHHHAVWVAAHYRNGYYHPGHWSR